MEPLSRRISIAIAIICIACNANAQSPDFPSMDKIEAMFYQTEVTITDVNQQTTGLATEYFDNTVPRGRVDLLVIGEKTTIHYNNDTQEVLHVNATTCNAYDSDIAEDAYIPLFYGWLNKEPLIIGPSAPLWYAQDHRSEIKPLGKTLVRSISCYKYSLDILGPRDNITIFYYFAADEWTTPYQMKGLTKVPVRIEIQGQSSKYAETKDEWVPYYLITDFAYFRPTITDWLVFQPPVGLGCHLKKATRTMPKFPKVFAYDAEVYDLIKSKGEEITDIEHHSVWYDSNRMIARLDRYTRQNYISEFYDFNTGVTYTNANWQTCTIKPLKNSFFEGYDGKLIGHMKYPNEVLNMDGTFYYMGRKLIRGIWTDAFESLQEDVVFQGKTLKKLVVTAYYSQDFYKVSVNGEIEGQIPIFYIVTGWSSATEMAIQLQYNIFGFDDVIWPAMYDSFGIGLCFPLMETKSYFLMIVDASPELAMKMEEQDDVITQEIRGQIAKFAKVSDMRIMINIDYKSSGVFITGVLLDRPPAISQFWLEYTGDVAIADPYLKVVVDGDSLEKCAYACVDEGDFTCTGFFKCKNSCFLKSKDLLDPTGDDEKKTPFGEVCETWLRATRDSLNNENYLADALMTLEDEIIDENFKLEISYTFDKKPQEMVIPISNIVIGDGPYTGDNNQEVPYTKVVNYAKLVAKNGEKGSATEDVNYVDNLNDCYKACKQSGSMSCASFSYCPDAENKQCRITPGLVVDRKKNPDDVEDDKNCFVYSMKYLDFFQEYPGRLVLIGGDDSFNQVKSLEDCAKYCRDATKFACRGFEYCRSTKSCVLHSKHVMDLKAGEIANVDKRSTCIHYAAKFSADYYDMGTTLIDDNSDKRSELTIEECARICSEELKDNCKSFNYCPESGPYMTDSSCALSGKAFLDKKVTTTTKDKCHHYEKKKTVDDWGKLSKKSLATVGYTSKGFTGLVIGMLALGLVLGAMGFVAYSYFRSKSSGEGMTVRFMKSDI